MWLRLKKANSFVIMFWFPNFRCLVDEQKDEEDVHESLFHNRLFRALFKVFFLQIFCFSFFAFITKLTNTNTNIKKDDVVVEFSDIDAVDAEWFDQCVGSWIERSNKILIFIYFHFCCLILFLIAIYSTCQTTTIVIAIETESINCKFDYHRY